MSLERNSNKLVCSDCGRIFSVDADLSEGDLCPSDDCPSHHEKIYGFNTAQLRQRYNPFNYTVDKPDKFGHPTYTVQRWFDDNTTLLGYWSWVIHKLEEEDFDEKEEVG